MRHAIINCYGLLKRVETDHVEDWYEKLLLEDLCTRVDLDDRRGHIVALDTFNYVASINNLTTLALSFSDTPFECLHLCLCFEGSY